MKVETIKKLQSNTALEMENLGKNSGVIDASMNNRIQEIEERTLGAEDTIENIDSTVKENAKCKKQKACDPKHPGNSRYNEKTKPKDYRYRREWGFIS